MRCHVDKYRNLICEEALTMDVSISGTTRCLARHKKDFKLIQEAY